MRSKLAKFIIIAASIFTLVSISDYLPRNNGMNSTSNSVSNFVKSLRSGDLDSLLSSVKDIISVDKNNNNKYNLVSPKDLEQYILDGIGDIKGIKIINEPKIIKIIKPIQKTPVKSDFRLGEINENTNKAVNDPGYKYEWDISYTEADKAWPLIKQKREINVAVLDTGVDYTHPDLKNRVLKSKGYNFVDNNSDTMDDNGHGTHVSGIIAANANDNIGIAGIDGTLDVKIIPIKVLDSNGEGDINDIVKGIKYAADNGADIINLSFGANEKSKLIAEAISYAKSKGVFVVAAAGNDNEDSDNISPAGDGAFTVAAMSYNYKKASFSDYGNCIKVSAPGVEILSTVPGGYEAWDGTSMAAPVATGIAAMVKAEDPNLSPSQIEDVLDSTAKDIMSKGKDKQSGYGLIDAYNAIKKVKQLEK
ncbi:S8 family peptidase [Clostridium beijerinckii]|jgi:Subtilisin-like serine proteases|uniref:Peptidase S8 n=2 Tax=Clostridium beijerinckii TaxID=1520 RepID=A0A140DM90_CLOBE|nr:S8 family peptidase [Clostridium beijerinckii]ABR33614.1 peptidase S8 and S53, subtilisin, kexin, sedolisin [Clostridium beijerinckii NCIMB 8052]AIU03025.1 peptidase S8/S53 subtilisin kexin sedolisin [Clostridium beijerinckii ATCC 35702]AMK50355.1 peptidase S8 [Clostridium beijerinckii]MBF7812030.1 peptidase S8 [Clostridium beijerinckii]NRT25116.1 subtilisin family serine protease [Clostridium beijerinckii]